MSAFVSYAISKVAGLAHWIRDGASRAEVLILVFVAYEVLAPIIAGGWRAWQLRRTFELRLFDSNEHPDPTRRDVGDWFLTVAVFVRHTTDISTFNLRF